MKKLLELGGAEILTKISKRKKHERKRTGKEKVSKKGLIIADPNYVLSDRCRIDIEAVYGVKSVQASWVLDSISSLKILHFNDYIIQQPQK